MNADDVLEHQLVDYLRGQAVRAPAGDGWGGILDRVEQRHRRRQRRRAGATTLFVVALVGVVLSVRAGTHSEDSRVATDPSESGTGRLPHLVLDLPGFEADHASEAYLAAESRPSGNRSADELQLSILAQPGRGYDGRVLFVTTAGPETGYGVGDRSGSARTVEVSGQPAWLQQYTGLPSTSLGWYLASGQAVHLVGLRLSDDELLSAARNLDVAEDGSISWRDGQVPAGLALERTAVTPTGPRATAEVRYARGDEQVTLRIQEGGEAVLDDLVRDRAASALEIGETTVAGVPAVLSVYDGSDDRSSLMWQVRPGVVAELVARNSSSVNVNRAAATIREIDEAAWQGLLDRFAVAPPDPALKDTASRAASTIQSMCQLRSEWLSGDQPQQADAVRLLRNLRRHAIEVGLDRNTDVVAILDRLLAAASGGDRAAVRAIPEGGACTAAPR